MRRIRSVVALVSTFAVMACQTAVSMGGGVQAVPSSIVPASSHATVSATPAPAVSFKSSAPAPAAANGSKRRTIIIVAVLAAVVIAAVLISSGGDGGIGGY